MVRTVRESLIKGETTIAFVILKAEEKDVKSCENSINERVAKNIAKFAVPGKFYF